jgi:hypothetical protein
MNNDASLESIRGRFNEIGWHDSKLVTLAIVPAEASGDADILMDVILSEWDKGHNRAARVVLRDCTILKIDFDIASKRACSDDISYARCEIDSPLKSTIAREQLGAERNPLAQYLHFTFVLCPPSGEMHAFARTFDIAFG